MYPPSPIANLRPYPTIYCNLFLQMILCALHKPFLYSLYLSSTDASLESLLTFLWILFCDFFLLIDGEWSFYTISLIRDDVELCWFSYCLVLLEDSWVQMICEGGWFYIMNPCWNIIFSWCYIVGGFFSCAGSISTQTWL